VSRLKAYDIPSAEDHRVELELQENLEASEKIMASLNESWEEKLTKTQKIHADREQALEELGISLNKDQALVGVHAPKRWPHLVNLNEVCMLREYFSWRRLI
jgi:kinesin family protein 1